MDENNFQHELSALKKRISSLSFKYSLQGQRMSQQNFHPTQDLFSAQLQDLKAHIASIHDAMKARELSAQQYPTSAQGNHYNMLDHSPISAERRNITLPSGPLFWQLYNTLRTDVRTLDSRVAALEHNVSDLDDRVDALDPNRFTPPASTSGSEAGAAQLWTTPVRVANGSYSELHAMPEVDGNMKETYCWGPPGNLNPMGWPTTTGGHMFPNNSSSPSQNSRAILHGEFVQHQYQNNLRADLPLAIEGFSRLNNQHDSMSRGLSKLQEDNGALYRALGTISKPLDSFVGSQETKQAEVHGRSSQYSMPESIVFRDREIARMDEQLRIAHDRLRASEETVTQRDDLITQLRSERDGYDARARKEWNHKEEQLVSCRNQVAAKDTEIRELQIQIDERNNALRGWEESWNKLEDSYIHVSAKARAYEDWYKGSMAREKDEADHMGQMRMAHEEEMCKMKDFCEQKDAVIQKQEEIISRGGKLLEDRDGEIERMQRQLRAVEDDRTHAYHTQDRLNRLLAERDSQLAHQKEEGKSGRPKRNGGEKVQNATEPATSGPAKDSRAPLEPQQRVQAGESAAEFHRLPYGERRAYVWDNSNRETTREPGKLRYMPAPPDDTSRRHKGGGRHRRPQYRYYPELENQQSNQFKAREGAWQELETQGTVAPTPSEQGRQSRDDISRLPPLPAPVTARRMASEADLQSISNGNPAYSRQHLSKHKSMGELSKRRLQAYVETEGESGEEHGEV